MKEFICLNCGTINIYNKELECYDCKKTISTDIYRLVLKSARNSVIYGYQYRIQYEGQLKRNGAINAKYSLIAPSNYFEFMAAAIIAGVAGNFAYDAIKIVGQKIISSIKKKEKPSLSEIELIKIINNEKRLNKFIRYIIDYSNGLKGAKKLIREVIDEEILADTIGKLHKRLSKAVEIGDKKEMKRFLGKLNKEVSSKKNTIPKEIDKIIKQLKAKDKK